MKIAVLDDYLHLSQTLADWSKLPPGCEVTVFDRPLKVPDEAAEVLKPFDVLCHIRERMPMPRALIERLPNLKMIAITVNYHRTLDVAAATERGIVVSHAVSRPSANKSTCELAWALIFSVARHIPLEANAMKSGGWQHTAGFTLHGKTIGLLGLGTQGRHMVPVAKALGMNVIAWSPHLTDAIASEFGATRVSKDGLFQSSDVLSLHLVLADSTRNIVGARELALMKPSAVLINTSRGPLVEEQALHAALRERRIAGAGIDVYHREPLPDDDPIRTLPNVVLTPHLGYATREFLTGCYEDTIENIAAFANGKPIRILTADRNDSRLARK